MAEGNYSEIKIVRVAKAKNKDGEEFLTFKTIIKGGKLMDVCFQQSVTNKPTEPCIIRVADGKWNIDRSGFYPKCWIKEVLEILPLPIKTEENPFI